MTNSVTSSALSQLIDSLIENKEIKTKSLISTIFGDCGMPHGGAVWTKSLIEMLEPFQVKERLVRTSLFRLVEDGWLDGTRSGRHSYYQLGALGASQTRLAESIIYHPIDSKWDGHWTLVFLVIKPVSLQARSQLEQELQWMGFGKVSNHVWAHPLVNSDAVLERVRELDMLDKVVCMRCSNIQESNHGFKIGDRELAKRCMPIDEVQAQYHRFIERFKVFNVGIDNLNSQEQLTLRILIIDQYRKIALSDPGLPPELLPKIWDGALAFNISANIYAQVKSASDSQFISLINSVSELSIDSEKRRFEARFSIPRN